MALARLSPSRSKREFLEHLGLSENSENDRRIYRDMMDEAAHARERMCQNPNNLTPGARANPSLRPPYSSNMITETAQYREVILIYQTAGPSTLRQYEKGVFTDGSNWDNWVIRWCLWHVFRYRDERNRHRGQRGSAYYSPDDQPTSEGNDTDENDSTSQSTVYDPVRNIFFGNQTQ